jgi:predicted 2-oxoglutarate/Fe(II)-dependent dioxygenase YbiX
MHRALINFGGGVFVLDEEVRKCERSFVDSSEVAAWVFERVRSFLPRVLHGRSLIGINDRLRVLRYGAGDYFRPHVDGAYCFGMQRSQLTLQLYLNEDFEGGETRFTECGTVVRPATGTILIFDHYLEHEGCAVMRGQKECVRMDVMYSRFHDSSPSDVSRVEA